MTRDPFLLPDGTVPHVEERIMMFENQIADRERRMNGRRS